MSILQQIDLSKAGSNNFIMVTDRLPNMMYFIQNASMPSLTANQTILPFPTKATFSVPSPNLEYEELTLVILMDEKFKSYFSIVEWMQYNTKVKNFAEAFSDLNLLLLDNAKNPILSVKFIDAMPATISNFEMGSDDAHSFTFYATFKYHYFTCTYFDGTGSFWTPNIPEPAVPE